MYISSFIKKFLSIVFIAILFCQGPSFAQEKSLYERLGGVYPIAAVVDDFVDKLLINPIITANKNTVAGLAHITKPGLKYLLTEMICQAAGGPQKYTGKSMKEAHKDLKISEAEWEAMVKEFLASLGKFKVPNKEQIELVVIVGTTKADIVAATPAPPQAPAQAPPTIQAPQAPAQNQPAPQAPAAAAQAAPQLPAQAPSGVPSQPLLKLAPGVAIPAPQAAPTETAPAAQPAPEAAIPAPPAEPAQVQVIPALPEQVQPAPAEAPPSALPPDAQIAPQ